MKKQACIPYPLLCLCALLLIAVIGWQMLPALSESDTAVPAFEPLEYGASGELVSYVQQRLSELGYYDGKISGNFLEGTRNCLKRLQKDYGLEITGKLDEETWQLLLTAQYRVLKNGDDGDEVARLQQRLIDLGYLDAKATGKFRSATEGAVKNFQKQNGLEVTGVADLDTQQRLFGETALAKGVSPTPTPDPNALPILVNRTHPVDASYRPADLVQLKDVLPSSLVTVKGSDCEGDRTAAQALITMFEAAKADGVTGWQISAGYRSVKYQQKLFDRQVAEYQNQGLSVAKAKSAASKLVADPGASEHHTGLAFDITVPGTTFKGTEQQKWLQKHCWDYGFIIRYQEDKEAITGFLAECWHIRYVGVQHSVVMRDKNLCLEEYLGETD